MTAESHKMFTFPFLWKSGLLNPVLSTMTWCCENCSHLAFSGELKQRNHSDSSLAFQNLQSNKNCGIHHKRNDNLLEVPPSLAI